MPFERVSPKSGVASRTECHRCGSFVTDQFARVFGDNENRVYACIECATLAALRDGAAQAE